MCETFKWEQLCTAVILKLFFHLLHFTCHRKIIPTYNKPIIQSHQKINTDKKYQMLFVHKLRSKCIMYVRTHISTVLALVLVALVLHQLRHQSDSVPAARSAVITDTPSVSCRRYKMHTFIGTLLCSLSAAETWGDVCMHLMKIHFLWQNCLVSLH